MKKRFISLTLLGLSLSSCSLEKRYPFYHQCLFDFASDSPIRVSAWVDDHGDWMTGITAYNSGFSDLNLLAVYAMQRDYPCPLKDMARMIKQSGKDPEYIDLTILPYPIATEYDFQRMNRIGNYENWYIYLGVELGLLNEHSIDDESMEDYLGHSYELKED